MPTTQTKVDKTNVIGKLRYNALEKMNEFCFRRIYKSYANGYLPEKQTIYDIDYLLIIKDENNQDNLIFASQLLYPLV